METTINPEASLGPDAEVLKEWTDRHDGFMRELEGIEKIKAPGIELLSMHIPKTAGTSFRNILKKVYGEEQVARLDINKGGTELWLNEKLFTGKALPPEIKVLHGHYHTPFLNKRFKIREGTPLITWLRNPAERVLSNFYYLESRLKEILAEKPQGEAVRQKLQKNVTEYIQSDIARNRISKFFYGLAPEDCLFIGLQEHYEEDVERLGKMLNWPEVEILHHNKTPGKKIEAHLIEEAERYNSLDMAIYKKAIAMREASLG